MVERRVRLQKENIATTSLASKQRKREEKSKRAQAPVGRIRRSGLILVSTLRCPAAAVTMPWPKRRGRCYKVGHSGRHRGTECAQRQRPSLHHTSCIQRRPESGFEARGGGRITGNGGRWQLQELAWHCGHYIVYGLLRASILVFPLLWSATLCCGAANEAMAARIHRRPREPNVWLPGCN